MAESKSREQEIPDVGEVCMHFPLYRIIARGDAAQRFAEKLKDEAFQIDAYCIDCKRETPFKKWTYPNRGGGGMGSSRPGVVVVKEPAKFDQSPSANCARCGRGYDFYFSRYKDGIAKIGQVPSPADIASQDMLRFRGELEDLDLAELEHATRMFSLGIGVASYVYLRRIFERLLDRHHSAFVEANGPIEGYGKMNWEERVLALRPVLPPEVVENRRVYSILSLGIHELNEEQCLLYYPRHASGDY